MCVRYIHRVLVVVWVNFLEMVVVIAESCRPSIKVVHRASQERVPFSQNMKEEKLYNNKKIYLKQVCIQHPIIIISLLSCVEIKVARGNFLVLGCFFATTQPLPLIHLPGCLVCLQACYITCKWQAYFLAPSQDKKVHDGTTCISYKFGLNKFTISLDVMKQKLCKVFHPFHSSSSVWRQNKPAESYYSDTTDRMDYVFLHSFFLTGSCYIN